MRHAHQHFSPCVPGKLFEALLWCDEKELAVCMILPISAILLVIDVCAKIEDCMEEMVAKMPKAVKCPRLDGEEILIEKCRVCLYHSTVRKKLGKVDCFWKNVLTYARTK